MIRYTMAQRTPDWLAVRAGKITSSDAAAVLAGPLKSGGEPAAKRDLKARLLAERLTGRPTENGYTNADMQRGVDLEPAAVAAYEAHTGQLVDRSVGFLAHDELAAGFSPDGLLDDGRRILEVKCPRVANHLRLLRTGDLSDYLPQMTHALWLTGADAVVLVSYCPDLPPDLALMAWQWDAADRQAYELMVRQILREVDAELDALEAWRLTR